MAGSLLDCAPFRSRQDGTLLRVVETVRTVLDPDVVELEYNFLPEAQRYRCRFLRSQTSGARPVRSGRRVLAGPSALQATFRAPDLVEGTLTLIRRVHRPWTGAELRRFELLAPFLSLVLECAARAEIHELASPSLDDVKPRLVERGLSLRETEVVGAVLQGFRNAEIAAQLFITEWTVKDHMKHIFHKLGVSSRAGLLKALYAGLLFGKGETAGRRAKNPVVTPRPSC